MDLFIKFFDFKLETPGVENRLQSVSCEIWKKTTHFANEGSSFTIQRHFQVPIIGRDIFFRKEGSRFWAFNARFKYLILCIVGKPNHPSCGKIHRDDHKCQ